MERRDELSGMRLLLEALKSGGKSIRNGQDITQRQIEHLERDLEARESLAPPPLGASAT
jgi:hypothetical protein